MLSHRASMHSRRASFFGDLSSFDDCHSHDQFNLRTCLSRLFSYQVEHSDSKKKKNWHEFGSFLTVMPGYESLEAFMAAMSGSGIAQAISQVHAFLMCTYVLACVYAHEYFSVLHYVL